VKVKGIDGPVQIYELGGMRGQPDVRLPGAAG